MRQGLDASGMFILLSGTATRHWEGQGMRLETSWASNGAIFGYEEFVTLLTGSLTKKYLPLETVTISSDSATVLFLHHGDFEKEMDRFSNTHTLAKMLHAIQQREQIIEQARILRSKIENDNKAVMRNHVSGGRVSLHNFRGIGTHWFNVTSHQRIKVTDGTPLGARQKIRLGLIPKHFGSHVKQATLLNTTNALQSVVRTTPQKNIATTARLQESLTLNERDLARVSGADISTNVPKIHGSKGARKFETVSAVRVELEKLSTKQKPRVAQRPADRSRASYLSGKRSRWMKAARRAKRHARRKRRKAPQLDEFDDRIDRDVYSSGFVIGRIVRRL